MKDGICPKCKAKEVHVVENTAWRFAIHIKFLQKAMLNYHICTSCGYVELFVQEKSVLPRIAEKYPKVN